MERKELFPYQTNSFAHFQYRKIYGVFWEMRLGKSVVTLRWLREQEVKRVLIVTQNTAVYGWLQELRDYQKRRIFVVTGNAERRQEILDAVEDWNQEGLYHTYTIINYELIVKYKIAGWFDAIILDESSKIKNPAIKLTKHLLKHYSAIKYRICLSGTPNPESLLDFYSQMVFLYGNFLGYNNFYKAKRALYYHPPENPTWVWYAKKGAKERVYKWLSERADFLTRKEVKVGSHIMRETVVVEPTREQTQLMHQLEEDFALPADTEKGIESYVTKWQVAVQNGLARLAGGFRPEEGGKGICVSQKKAEELLLLLKDLKRQETHFVVWFRYKAELFLCRDLLKSSGLFPGCVFAIYGEVERRERFKLLDQWKIKGGVLLATVLTAKYGIDCSESDTAIYYSRAYDNESNSQSESRIIKATKKTPILIVDLVTNNSIDLDVLRAVREKKMNMKEVFSYYLERKRNGKKRSLDGSRSR